MTNLEIAQKIADKIDTHTEDQIAAMIEIISDLHGIERLHAVVSNLYMKSESFKFSKYENNQGYREIEAR